jgi:hypothetical protein
MCNEYCNESYLVCRYITCYVTFFKKYPIIKDLFNVFLFFKCSGKRMNLRGGINF